MKIGLTYNLKKDIKGAADLPDDFYAECDDLETVENVRNALAERHKEVVMIEADEDAFEKLRKIKPDLVFNMAEGVWGLDRESHMPAIMEMLRIPYTGSSPLSLAICLNKARAKEILEHYVIPTPRFEVVSNPQETIKLGFSFPVIVKPLYEGSSKGIKNDCLVKTEQDLAERVARIVGEYKQSALVEEFLPGREFTVAIIGNGADIKVLPLVEINYKSLPAGVNHIYSYEAKWVYDKPEAPLDIFNCPAKVEEKLKRVIEKVAVDAYKALDVKDWCRVDVRLDMLGMPNIIELNPLPGILMDPSCNSCFPKAARSAGMTFSEVINAVADAAIKRYGL